MITLLIGTNRPDANSRKIALEIESIYKDIKVESRLLDLIDLPPELFSPEAYAEKPETFKPFVEAILKADGLHVVTPEYNGGFPGVLKYFIDMLPFPESFEGRAVAFTGPIEQLQQLFSYRNGYLYPNRVFIPGIHSVIDDSGKLKDEKLKERLVSQAEGFARFVKILPR